MRAVHTAILGDFLLLADSGTWGDEALPTEGHPVVRSTNIVDNRLTLSVVAYRDIPARHTRSKRLESGDIVVTSSSGSPEHIGKCAILEGEGAGGPLYFSNFTLRLRADQSRLMPKYLYHWLKSAGGRAVLGGQSSTTTGLRNLNKRAYLAQRLPLPPLAQQRRIADLLDRADAVQRKREESRRLVDELLRSVFLEMFGDPVRNENGWEVKRIGDLCRVLGGKRLPKGSAYSEAPTPFRYVRATDIGQGRVDESNLRFLTQEVQARIARYTVSEGDLIITIAGTIGEVAPVEASLGGANLTENAAKLCAIEPGTYDPHFLAALLRDPSVKASLLAETGQVTIQKLALFRIERVSIPLPPIELQRAYAERALRIERLRDCVVTATASTGDLGSQIQDELFGRLGQEYCQNHSGVSQ